MKQLLLGLALLLTGAQARAASFSANCTPDQVSILCPQTITEGSTVAWSGGHLWNGTGTQFRVQNDPVNGDGYFDITGSTIRVRGPFLTNVYGGAAVVASSFRGTPSAPTATQAGDNLGFYAFGGYDGSGFTAARSRMLGFSGENFSSTNQGSGITFQTVPLGSTTRVNRLTLNPNGGVGVGFAPNSVIPQILGVAGNAYITGGVGLGTSTINGGITYLTTNLTGFYDQATPPPAGTFIVNSTGVVVRDPTNIGWSLRTATGLFGYGFASQSTGLAVTGNCQDGTEAAPTACPDGAIITFIGAKPYDGVNPTTTVGSNAAVVIVSSGTADLTNRGTTLRLETTSNGTTQRRQRLVISKDGQTTIAPRANVVTPLGQLHVRGSDVGLGISNPVSIYADEAITSLSSVNASGFFGNGAGLTNVNDITKVPLAGGTMTGTLNMSNASIAATGSSGFISSQSSITASAFFGNGANLTSISRSSCTSVPNTSFTNTTFGVAIATVSLITRGFPVRVNFTATAENTTANIDMFSSLLIDGTFPSEFGGSAKAVGAGVAAQGGDDISLNYTFMANSVSAGSHTFAAMVRTTANTGTILNNSSSYAQFCATEVP